MAGADEWRGRRQAAARAWDGRALSWDGMRMQARARTLSCLDCLPVGLVGGQGTVGWLLRSLSAMVLWPAVTPLQWLAKRTHGRKAAPAVVQYTPETVVSTVIWSKDGELRDSDGVKAMERTASLDSIEPTGDGLEGEHEGEVELEEQATETLLVPTYLDRLTLEITPPRFERLYMDRHISRWLLWHVAEKMVSVVVALAVMYRALAFAPLEVRGRATLVVMMVPVVLLSAISAWLGMLPQGGRLSLQLAAVLEVLSIVAQTFIGFCPELLAMAFAPPKNALSGSIGSQTTLGLLTAAWLSKLWLRGSYPMKYMLLVCLGQLSAFLVTLLLRAPEDAIFTSTVRLAATAVLATVCYCCELRQRRAFLRSLSEHNQRGPAPASVPRHLVGMRRQREEQLWAASAGWEEVAAVRKAEYTPAARATGGAVAPAGLEQDVRLASVFFHMPHSTPMDITPEFRDSLESALRKQGYRLHDSYIVGGSTWLVLRLQNETASSQQLDVQSVVQQLLGQQGGCRQLEQAAIQSGGQLCVVGAADASLSTVSPVEPVRVRDVTPRVQLAGSRCEVEVLLGALPTGRGAPMFMVLRNAVSCMQMKLQHVQQDHAWSCIRLCQSIQLPSHCTGYPLDVLELEVCDQGVFSPPTPLVVCSSSEMRQELMLLEAWARVAQPGMQVFNDLLWGVRDMAYVWNCLAPGPQADELLQRVARELSGTKPPPSGGSREHQRAQGHVLAVASALDRIAPRLLLLAASLRLPLLLQLLLRDAVSASLMLRWQQGESGGSSNQGLPSSCSDEAYALFKLLQDAGRLETPPGLPLHAGSGPSAASTLAVLQAEIERMGLHPCCVDGLLVKAGLADQAVASNRTAASQALSPAPGRPANKGAEPTDASGSGERAPPLQQGAASPGRGVVGWTLRFQDDSLEKAYWQSIVSMLWPLASVSRLCTLFGTALTLLPGEERPLSPLAFLASRCMLVVISAVTDMHPGWQPFTNLVMQVLIIGWPMCRHPRWESMMLARGVCGAMRLLGFCAVVYSFVLLPFRYQAVVAMAYMTTRPVAVNMIDPAPGLLARWRVHAAMLAGHIVWLWCHWVLEASSRRTWLQRHRVGRCTKRG